MTSINTSFHETLDNIGSTKTLYNISRGETGALLPMPAVAHG